MKQQRKKVHTRFFILYKLMSIKVLNKVANNVKYSRNKIKILEFYLRMCSLPLMQVEWELINWKKYILIKSDE